MNRLLVLLVLAAPLAAATADGAADGAALDRAAETLFATPLDRAPERYRELTADYTTEDHRALSLALFRRRLENRKARGEILGQLEEEADANYRLAVALAEEQEAMEGNVRVAKQLREDRLRAWTQRRQQVAREP